MLHAPCTQLTPSTVLISSCSIEILGCEFTSYILLAMPKPQFHLYTIIPSYIWTEMTKEFSRVWVTKQSSNRRNMALVSSFFGIRFSLKQLKIRPMSSNKRLPCELNCGFARSSLPWNSRRRGKIYVKTRNTTRTGEKEQNEGQQTINFGCLAPHIRYLYVTNFHYDGNIRRHLEARNNQSAMRNQPTWYTFQSSLLLSMLQQSGNLWRHKNVIILLGRPYFIPAVDGSAKVVVQKFLRVSYLQKPMAPLA